MDKPNKLKASCKSFTNVEEAKGLQYISTILNADGIAAGKKCFNSEIQE